MTILDEIVARTRERLASAQVDIEALRDGAAEVRCGREAHRFAKALRAPGGEEAGSRAALPPRSLATLGMTAARIIAEIKAASPSAGLIAGEDADVERIAADYVRGGAAAISVVTEPEFFRGSTSWLSRAATAGLPVIMKDFVETEEQLLRGIRAGADAILLLASLLESDRIAEFIALLDGYGCDALVEVHDERELERAVAGGARLIGVNNRDLKSFRVDLGTAERLAPAIPPAAIRVAESGIRTRSDIERLQASGFGAFLVGESLLRQNDRAAALRGLLGGSDS